MQWLIDIIFGKVMLYFQGMIVIWSGTLNNIPNGWALCDGTNGTPNLTARFVRGAHDGELPGGTGGFVSHPHFLTTHAHDFTGDGHGHRLQPGAHLAEGTRYSVDTDSVPAVGTTDTARSTLFPASSMPPYYALAFIMKL